MIFFLLLPCFLAFDYSSGAAGSENSIRLATGSTRGIYYQIGQGIAEIARSVGIEIMPLTSQGSVENLKWLEQGDAELAIVQSDALFKAIHGLQPLTLKYQNIMGLAVLYVEAVHVLVRNPINIKKIEDLRGKRICIGPAGSGTAGNALALLEAAGITSNEFQLINQSIDESLTALRLGTVDVVFFTSGFPSPLIAEFLESKSVYLFEPNPEVYERLVNIYPYYRIVDIPSGTYATQEGDVTYLGVTAILVCRRDLSDEVAGKLLKAIFSYPQQLKKFFKNDVILNLVPVHEEIVPIKIAAKVFYTNNWVYFKNKLLIIINYFVIFIIILGIIFIILRFRKKVFFKNHEFIKIILVLLVIWIFGSIILYISEHKFNENYGNLLLAFWSCLINWFSFGQKEPYTLIGRITSSAMLVLGVGGIAWLTGEIASIFVHKKLMGGQRMIQKLQEHFVIINWNEKGYGIIGQLRDPELEKRDIVIVTTNQASPPSFPAEHDRIYFLNDISISESLLKKANVHLAHSVIILADSMNETGADASSVIIILAIRRICEERGFKQVPIVAEILDPSKVDLANYAGFLGNGYVETVSSKYLGQGLLSQAAVNPGVTSIYEDLLTFGHGTQEIYGIKIPPGLVGKTYLALCQDLLNLAGEGIHIIPIAISRQGQIYINPARHHIEHFEENDILFAICDSIKELHKIERLS